MVVDGFDHVPGHSRSDTKEARGIITLSCHARVKFRDIFFHIVSGCGK
jgi:hypothetical protein